MNPRIDSVQKIALPVRCVILVFLEQRCNDQSLVFGDSMALRAELLLKGRIVQSKLLVVERAFNLHSRGQLVSKHLEKKQAS
jgi:hypothetical protein